MKKYWLILLTIFAGNTYATYDATRGALQNDPSLCSYGYNPNCSSQGGYSNAQVGPPVGSDYYAAIAINKATGDWGWSTGFLGESVAIMDARMHCEKAERGECEGAATQLNGCLAMASSKDKNGNWTYFFSRSGICGTVEQEALLNCQASKAKNCQIEIRQLDANYKYYMYQ